MKPSLGKKSRNYRQGIFTPQNPTKYRGSLPIVYRSAMELKSFRMLDSNSNIISWGSESVVIPYQCPLDKKLHRYFVDLVALMKDKDGTEKKLLIEIKPAKFTIAPTQTANKKPKTLLYEQLQWVKNQAKWEAAKNWSQTHGFTFFIMTEKDLVSG